MPERLYSRPMREADAKRLWNLISVETAEYLEGFTPFQAFEDLRTGITAAKNDHYQCLLFDGTLAGFFMLRGLDEGFARPSYGVYVSSRVAGKGLGRYALDRALGICRDQAIDAVFLKVFPRNDVARKIYEEAGFKMIGTCPDTAQIMMERKLIQ